jgi:hypothetical protein
MKRKKLMSMSMISKIVERSKSPKPMGAADRQHQLVQQQLARNNAARAEQAKAAADEAKAAAEDIAHAEVQREIFVKKERPSQSELAIWDADKAVYLQQRVVNRTKPKPITLNDGSLQQHPAVGKLARLHAALRQAIAVHERLEQIKATPISAVNSYTGSTSDYLKGRG